MPGKPGGEENSPLGDFRDKLSDSDLHDNETDYVCSMNRDNLLWEQTQFYQENTKKQDSKNEISNNMVPNSPVHAYKFFRIKNPSKVGNINSSNQHFYQMVTLDTDWSTDSTHDDNVPKHLNGSLNQTADSGVIADISNNNIQNESSNLEETLRKAIQTNQPCTTVEHSSGKELSTASDSGTERSPDMSLETATTTSESGSSQKSKKTKKSVKSVFSSSSWSGGDQEDVVESSCDASGEESGESDSSDEFSTATEDSQDNLFDSVIHLNESASKISADMASLSKSFLVPPTKDNNNRQSKERPWSVIELYEQSNGLDLKPFFVSDSALDRLTGSQDLTPTSEFTPTKNSCHPNFTSATFPRLKGKEKIIQAFHSTTDDVPLHPGVKRKLQNDFYALDLCHVLGTLSRDSLAMQGSRSESESDTKELTRQLQNTTVCSGMSDTESDSGGKKCFCFSFKYPVPAICRQSFISMDPFFFFLYLSIIVHSWER